MNVLELIKLLNERGIAVKSDGNKLILHSDKPLDEYILNLIKDHKQELINNLNIEGDSAIKVLEPSDNGYVLSPAQNRLWILSQFENIGSAYNMPWVFTWRGSLEISKLIEAYHGIIQKHEALRTTFDFNETAQLRQFIWPFNADHFQVEIEDRNIIETTKLMSVSADVNAFISQEFDLQKLPLIRLKIFKCSNHEYILAFCFHHIIADGSSIHILQQELLKRYQDNLSDTLEINEEQTSNVTYKDFSDWHVKYSYSDEGMRSKQYWLDRLKRPLPIFEVLGSKPRPENKTFRSGTRAIHFAQEDISGLMELTRQEKSTLYISLFTLVTLALSEFLVEDEMVVGCPVDGRISQELEHMVGYFVNVLPIHVQLDSNISFKQHYKNVREQVFGALEHQNYPLDEIVDSLEIKRDRSRNPLFDVVITMDVQQADVAKEHHSQQISSYDQILEFDDSKFDLTFGFNKVETGIEFTLKYNVDIYDHTTIDTILQHIEKLFLGKINYHDCKISEIEWFTSKEREFILEENLNFINNITTEATVVSLFENQVSKSPDSIAMVFENNNWTYKQLNEKANAFAHFLIECKGVKKGDFVGIEQSRNDYLITSILAVIKAGAAYVPINPDYPEFRKQFIIEDANLTLVLNDNELDSFKLWSDGHPTHYDNPISGIIPADVAYVMYTSGSTGNPKGVLVEHRNIVRLIRNPNYIDLNEKDRLLQTGAIEFDASTFEIWSILANGAQLHILSSERVKTLNHIRNYISEKGITVMWFTSSFFDSIVIEDIFLFAGLKKVIVGGSVLTPSLIKRVKDKFPDLIIVNGYGPTENTTFSLAYSINNVEEKIPIGKPVNGTTAYIFTRNGKLAPCGVIGEILVGGAGLARGYLNAPYLTEEKFITNPYKSGERLYRTGDLGRLRPDGNFEYFGRIDEQIKIRGYRIEPGEVELTLSQHPQAGQVAVIAQALGSESEKELIAYATGEATPEELKRYLKDRLPQYMVPTYYVKLEKIPLTGNGKVDRRALPKPQGTGIPEVTYVAPRTVAERKLAMIWTEVLGISVETLSIKADFFDLGGHSLKAIRLLGRIYKQLGIKLTFKDLFINPTIEQISLFISANSGSDTYSPIPVITEQTDYRLSSSQRRLWVLSKFDAASEAYNMPQLFRLHGRLNDVAFIKAYSSVLERHEILRTVFIEDTEGNPRQRILLSTDTCFSVSYKDYSEQSKEDSEQSVKDYIAHEMSLGFNLEQGPLIRCSLLKESEHSYVVVLMMHHIVSDGWSLGIMHREWSEFYNAILEERQPDLEPLRIQYKDYAAWHNTQLESESIQHHKAYWLEQFSGELPILELPVDHPRPKVMTYNGASVYKELDQQTTDRLRAFSQEQGGTMFMTIQTALLILLHKYTGQEDIVIGSPIAGREHPDLEGQIGFYIHTLALRNRFKKEDTVSELFQKIKQNTLGAYNHQNYPYDELIDALNLSRDTSRNPLFDVMMVLQSKEDSESSLEFTQTDIHPYKTDEISIEAAKFDLSFGFEEQGEGINYSLHYNSDIYSNAQACRMLSNMGEILSSLTKHIHDSISEIEILTQDEKTFLLQSLIDTKSDYPSDMTIVDLFESQVEKTPDNVAIIFNQTKLTYQRLNELANELAHYLLYKYQIKPNDLIGIELERSEWMVIGILAIIKSGGAYVPIDTKYPDQRKTFIKEDACLKVIINEEEISKFNQISCSNSFSPANPNVAIRPNHLLYVIYTSGSTGIPKGCMLEHAGLVNRLNWMQKSYPLTEQDCILQKTTFTFDVSVWELIWWSLQGASVSILEPGGENQPEKIIHNIAESGVTVLHFVPSMLAVFLEYLSSKKEDLHLLTNLKQVYTSGEALHVNQALNFKEILPHVNLMNLYGPTEASIDVSFYACTDKEEECIPIGKPIDNTTLYVLDAETQELVPYGSAGEICIGGVGLARGYLNRPELTEAKFIDNPFNKREKIYRTGDIGRWREDGNLEYLGRIDDQVKIRGYRIELGEIEQVLSLYPGLSQVVVIARVLNNISDPELIAYFTGAAMAEELKNFLRERLPHYMVPNFYVKLDKIQLTSNGKVDRKVLPNPEGTGMQNAVYVAPLTETEKHLIKIWSEILGIDEKSISIKADFFTLGGNSLNAIKLITRIHSLLEIRLLISDLFLNSELESLARMIDSLNNTVNRNFEMEL